jgi:hypothetical protein
MDFTSRQWQVQHAPDSIAHIFSKLGPIGPRAGRPIKHKQSFPGDAFAISEEDDEEVLGFYNTKSTANARRPGVQMASDVMVCGFLTANIVDTLQVLARGVDMNLVGTSQIDDDTVRTLQAQELLWTALPHERLEQAISRAAVASELNLNSSDPTTDACLVPSRFERLRCGGSGLASDRMHMLQWLCRHQNAAQHASQRRRFAHYGKRRLGLGDASCTLLARQGLWAARPGHPKSPTAQGTDTTADGSVAVC